MSSEPCHSTDVGFEPTASQQAALARLHHAAATAGTVAILCGPAGCGKSVVLAMLRGQRGVENVRIVDDAHLLDGAAIDAVAREVAAVGGPSAILCGQGRLLTLVARNQRLEGRIELRATIHPMTRAESRTVAERLLRGEGATHVAIDESFFETLHDIAGGMPRAVVSLARFARMLVDASPELRLGAGHVERIHRRLSVTAA